MINKLKQFEDNLINDNTLKILKFGEYRKGSNEYGDFIQELMMFLRNFKKQDKDELLIKVKDVTFDVNQLFKLNNDINKNKLITFDIKFLNKNKKEIRKPKRDGYIIFYNLNKKDNRPWEYFEY